MEPRANVHTAGIPLPTEAERKAEMFTQEDMQDSCRKQKRDMYTDILSAIGNSGMDRGKKADTGRRSGSHMTGI